MTNPSLALVLAAPDGQVPERVSDASALFLVTSLGLLLAFIVLMVVMARLRSRRRGSDRTPDRSPTPDPWEESGRRTQPYEPR